MTRLRTKVRSRNARLCQFAVLIPICRCFAPEGAVPGDRIVGIMQPGAGITIYPIQSPALTAYDDQPDAGSTIRWILMRGCTSASQHVSVSRQSNSRAPLAKLHKLQRQMMRIFIICRWCGLRPTLPEMIIDVEVWDLRHLNRIISQLKESTSVSGTTRVNG